MAYQGGWGGGQRGNSNWGGGSGRGRGYQGNQRGGGGGGGRHQQGPSTSTTDWREAVKADRVPAERPLWELSCYGHEREAPNDIPGDISPEEVRWANMLSAQRGASMQQLAAEFKAACRAKVEQLIALPRAQRPPSKGGPPLPPPTATIRGLEWVTGDSGASLPMSAGPIQQGGGLLFGAASSTAAQPSTSTPFGAPAASTGGFGQPKAFGGAQQPLFGQLAAQPAPLAGGGGGFGQPAAFGAQPSTIQPTGPPAGSSFGGTFGAPSSGGFGGTFGSAGAAGKMAFGQQQQQGSSGQPSFGSTPFGGGGGGRGGAFSAFNGASTTSASPAFAGGAFGAPSVFGSAPSTFGGAPATAAATSSFKTNGGVFGQAPLGVSAGAPATGMFGQPAPVGNGMDAQTQSPEDDSDAEIWKARAFEKGRIPERAPPFAYCR